MVVAYAPGRVELLGNHTDYNEGLVLAVVLERGVTIRGYARDDRRVVLTSETLGESHEESLDELEPSKAQPWAHFVLGVVDQYQRRGVKGPGFEVTIASTLPLGAGLSSSAALECATARFLQDLWGSDFSSLELAKIAQAAEQDYVGVECGLLDQIASLFGHPGSILCIDFRSLEVEQLSMPEGGRLVVAPSGAPHSLSDGEYNERRATCEAAARALGVEALRDVDSVTVQAASALTPHQRRRALHIVGENERVERARGLIRRGHLEGLGELLDQSHKSSRVNFENSSEELDVLVEAARRIPGCLGARLTGGGFGGATVNLVRSDGVKEFRERLALAFERRFDRALDTLLC